VKEMAEFTIYWKRKRKGNNFYLFTANAQCAPTYNTYYGFPDGAQHQIFTNSPAPPPASFGDTLFSVSAQGPSAISY
jgi:hypothetical protein